MGMTTIDQVCEYWNRYTAILEADLAKAKEENRALRELLFRAHGNAEHYLYGDDGERQCNLCMIDFVRDDPRVIESKINAQAWKKYNIAMGKDKP